MNEAVEGERLSGVLRRIREKGLADKTPIIEEASGRFLRMMTLLSRPEKILEIGTGYSYSTHWMLSGHPGSMITGIDQNWVRIAVSKKFLRESGLAHRVELKQVWAKEHLANDSNRYDLIFLDGMKKEYSELKGQCLEKLVPGGVLIADNVLFKGMLGKPLEEVPSKYRATVESLSRFNASLAADPILETFIYDIGDGISVSIKKG